MKGKGLPETAHHMQHHDAYKNEKHKQKDIKICIPLSLYHIPQSIKINCMPFIPESLFETSRRAFHG